MPKFMTIDEMRKREWAIGWSGGKDSTATIIAAIKYGVPIKEINYVRMMYNDTLPATPPIMTQFVDAAAQRFRDQYGLTVNIVKSVPARKIFDRVRMKSVKYPELNGYRYTVGGIGRGMCEFMQHKRKALKSITKSEYELIGYAADEPKRYHRLQHPYQESILCTLGIKEEQAFNICSRNGLLSPLYSCGITRDGCWFCPNMGRKQIDFMKSNYPELVLEIYNDLSVLPDGALKTLSVRNNWVCEYIKDRGVIV